MSLIGTITEKIETSIIPIEYHNKNTQKIAEQIKNIIEQNKEIFSAILSPFVKISFNEEEYKYENVLVISDSDNNVVTLLKEAINKKYNINELCIPILLSSMTNEQKKIYLYKNLEELDFSSLYLMLLENKMYEELTTLCENYTNYESYKRKFIENNLFFYLNNLLEDNKIKFIDNNIEFIKEVLMKTSEEGVSQINVLLEAIEKNLYTTFEDENNNNPSEEYIDNKNIISLEETIKNVKEFLKEIDPSESFLTKFVEAVKNNRLLFVNQDNIQEMQRIFYNNTNYPLQIQNEPFFYKNTAYIPLTNTITDILTIVHEFIHLYASQGEYEKSQKKYSLFTEVISIFYEKRVADYLIAKGYDKDAVEGDFKFRSIINSCNNVSGINQYIWMQDLKKKHGKINVENIMTNEQIEKEKSIYEFQSLINPTIEYSYKSDKQIIIEYTKNIIKKIESIMGDGIHIYLSYAFGTYYATANEIQDVNNKMFYITNNINNPEFDDDYFVNVLNYGIPTIEEEPLKLCKKNTF